MGFFDSNSTFNSQSGHYEPLSGVSRNGQDVTIEQVGTQFCVKRDGQIVSGLTDDYSYAKNQYYSQLNA